MSKKKAERPDLRLIQGDLKDQLEEDGFNLLLPSDEKEVIKEVPAKIDGVEVGLAQIYDDGTVDVILYSDAPAEALEKLKETAAMMGFSMRSEE